MFEMAGMIPLPIVAEISDGRRQVGGSPTLDADSTEVAKASCPTASGPALVAQLLGEQQSFSAADRFSQWHRDWATGTKYGVHGADDEVRPARYHSLLPATPPAPGQQYAFEVDLDRCSGCKACVVACHTLNGLDENETWREVGLLIGGSRTAPVMQHVTAACHHCLQPACMIACPVNAYEKDPVTGIVKHLDEQCFGCQYCTMACPYEVPKYHAGMGIVRKCDMCSSRLAVGEAPACVQACPHQAISIGVVDRDQVVHDAETSTFLPAAPDPQITLPTTTYKSRRAFPRNLLPADYFRVNAQHAHWPLVVMLVLTQLSVGALAAELILQHFLGARLLESLRPLHATMALVFGVLAAGASLFHLGRPRFAFRAVLGLRHSWLSREIVAFGVFATLASVYAGAIYISDVTADEGAATSEASVWIESLGWSAAATGLFAVFCSTMIYVFTQRECWSFVRVGVRFALTSALLGVAAVWLSILAATLAAPSEATIAWVRHHGSMLSWTLVALAAAKLAWEGAAFRHLWLRKMTPLKRSALLMTGDLSNVTLARFALGLLGGVILPTMLAADATTPSHDIGLVQFVVITGLLFAACLAGELLERYLFFAACAAPQMPGDIR
jgi:Fe-S-cluster-containing dehydrogenase component/DMSO reductase anchor subunit